MPSNMTEKIMEGKCACGYKFRKNDNYCPECGMKNWFKIKGNKIHRTIIEYKISDWGNEVGVSVYKVTNPDREDYYDDIMIMKHTSSLDEALQWITDHRDEHRERFLGDEE